MIHRSTEAVRQSEHRLARKLGIAQISMIAVAVLGLLALAVIYRIENSWISDQEDQSAAQLALADQLEKAELSIRYDIVQVQEVLTDVSATRQLGGAGSDDWAAAGKFAGRFHRDIASARGIARTLHNDELLRTIDTASGFFSAFYKVGFEMAHSYVDGGPEAGNKIMPVFDQAAGQLNAAIGTVQKHVAAIRTQDNIRQAAVERTKASVAQFTLGLSIVGALLLMAAGALLLRFVNRRLMTPLGKTTRALSELAGGNLEASVDGAGRQDEVGMLVRALNTFRQSAIDERRRAEETLAAERRMAEETNTIVTAVAEGLEALAKGRLAHRLTIEMNGAFAKLKADFNAAVEHLQDAMRTVSSTTRSINSGAGEIMQATDDLSKRTEHQAASLEETAAALEEITATVKKTAENAREVSTIVASAKGAAEKGGAVVERAMSAVSQIEQSSKKITDIIGVIDEIAFQTNLLALNAGVEAARAGDAGKGFAVVASEVRALAQRSGEAAKEIKTLIKASSDQVGAGVRLVGESGQALKQLAEQVIGINVLVGEMADAAQQQSTGIEEVNTAVSQMDQVTQQNAAMVEQSTAASRNLSQETGELARLMAFFDVGDAAAPDKPAIVAQNVRPAPPRRAVAAGRRHLSAVPKPEADAAADDWQEF